MVYEEYINKTIIKHMYTQSFNLIKTRGFSFLTYSLDYFGHYINNASRLWPIISNQWEFYSEDYELSNKNK